MVRNPMQSIQFQIGEAAELLGVTQKTLRHYHAIGLLDEPIRDTNNYRLYTTNHIEKVQVILRLKSIGLSLNQIKTIFAAPDPDEAVRITLRQHAKRIQSDILSLQNSLEDIEDFLASDITLAAPWKPVMPEYDSLDILASSIRGRSSELADMLIEFEGDALAKLDTYQWSMGYDVFWEQAAEQLGRLLNEDDLSQLIFWMERYLALDGMDPDDLQGRAWLQEFIRSPARPVIARTFAPPSIEALSAKEQQAIQKVFFSLLYQQGNTFQKQFLMLLQTTR
jgi:DNA-binding transcriptional MerR regulator